MSTKLSLEQTKLLAIPVAMLQAVTKRNSIKSIEDILTLLEKYRKAHTSAETWNLAMESACANVKIDITPEQAIDSALDKLYRLEDLTGYQISNLGEAINQLQNLITKKG